MAKAAPKPKKRTAAAAMATTTRTRKSQKHATTSAASGGREENSSGPHADTKPRTRMLQWKAAASTAPGAQEENDSGPHAATTTRTRKSQKRATTSAASGGREENSSGPHVANAAPQEDCGDNAPQSGAVGSNGDSAQAEEIAPTCTDKRAFYEFWNIGFTTTRSTLKPEVLEGLLKLAKRYKFREIFSVVGKDGNDSEMDKHRFQAHLDKSKDKCVAVLKEEVERITLAMNSKWQPNTFVFLKSTAGGVEQEAHRDFLEVDTVEAQHKEKAVPGGVLVAIMDKTKLVVYPKSCAGAVRKETKTTVELKAGEFLIFRGDLVHSGASYDSDNYRVHCLLSVKGVARFENTTSPVAFREHMCPWCTQMFDIPKDKHNHSRYCKDNPKRTQLRDARDKNDKLGKWCPCCDRKFDSKHTCNVHQGRMKNKQEHNPRPEPSRAAQVPGPEQGAGQEQNLQLRPFRAYRFFGTSVHVGDAKYQTVKL